MVILVMHHQNMATNNTRTMSAVFHAGPSTSMHWFKTTGEGSVKSAGTRPGGNSANGNAVMLDAGKILAFGGSEAFAKADYPARNDCSLIELGKVNKKPRVAKLSGMKKKRVYGNAVVLPDGKIFATGGASKPREFHDGDAHYQPGACFLPTPGALLLWSCTCFSSRCVAVEVEYAWACFSIRMLHEKNRV